MRVVITISCDNAAFDPIGPELARILAELATRWTHETEPAELERKLFDANGNACGKVGLLA